jgi:hypothetical protein
MVNKLQGCGGESPLTFSIIRDLFDAIDVRRDGIIDTHEWGQTFAKAQEGDKATSIKVTPATLRCWEETKDGNVVGTLIGKHRKIIQEELEKVANGSTFISNSQVKETVSKILHKWLPAKMDDDKWKIVLQIGSTEKQGVDYKHLLQVYKERLDNQNLFPVCQLSQTLRSA